MVTIPQSLTLPPLPPSQDMEERRCERWPIRLPATLHSSVDRDVAVIVADLSTHGCRLVMPGVSVVGRFVTLAVTSFLSIEGWIAWTNDDGAGLAFAHRVPAPVIAELVRRGTTAPAPAAAAAQA